MSSTPAPKISKSHIRKFPHLLNILGELLPVLGTIGLLGLWLYQQTRLEARSNELRKIASAHAVFQTYQSHNAVFNAINAGFGNNKDASDQLRVAQLYNYELGLMAIEEARPKEDVANIPKAPNAFSGTPDTQTKMEITQRRLELLQTKLHEREAAVGRAADLDQKKYLRWYVALSIISIFGAVCSVIEKFDKAPS